MTAHELARQLLAGPDLPVVVCNSDPIMFNEVREVGPATYFDTPAPWFDVNGRWTSEPSLEMKP